MLENTWYSVISPESCSSILWRSWDYKEKAAEQLHLTSGHMKGFGLVDDVLPEPPGGAHNNADEIATTVKKYILKSINALSKLSPEQRFKKRVDKFSKMGFYDLEKA